MADELILDNPETNNIEPQQQQPTDEPLTQKFGLSDEQISNYKSILEAEEKSPSGAYTKEDIEMFKTLTGAKTTEDSNADENTDEKEKLLAGKYKTVEELEKAYGELQRKLSGSADKKSGDSDKPTPENADKDKPEENKLEESLKIGDLDCQPIFDEFEKTGDVSKENYNKLAAAVKKQGLAKAYLDAYIQNAKAARQAQQGLSMETQSKLLEPFGGQEEFAKLKAWAKNNVDKSDIETFNKAMWSGDKGLAHIALAGLFSAYNKAMGSSTKDLLKGNADVVKEKENSGGYSSVEEIMAAMGNRKYTEDPSYRASVTKKFNKTSDKIKALM